MAENTNEAAQASAICEKEDKKLQDIFLEGWNRYEELEETSLTFSSAEFQSKVKSAMEHFETATRIVSQIGMFSPNELIDEVSTESLQYLMLPFFLGKLALKLHQPDRARVLNVAEAYLKDFLQRCEEYDISDAPKSDIREEGDIVSRPNGNSNEIAQLMRAAHARNDKIAQFRRKKELDEHIKLMKEAVKNGSVDDEIKREFFLKFLKMSAIDAQEELDSLKLEKQMVEMRKMYMSAGIESAASLPSGSASSTTTELSHSRRHGHSHPDMHRGPVPKPKPLQPFIITRDATQKAVFGMGYPSLPVMSVDEFYQQRVHEGIFPDEEKVSRMNQAQAIAAVQDPNEKEDEEKAAEDDQIERDDPENLARMRRMDEYKDEVRRGDGNRHNRS